MKRPRPVMPWSWSSFWNSLATARGETWRTSSATEIERFRDDVARRLTKQTANFALKAIRSALRRAKVHGLTDANQAERVATLPKDFDSARRAFTEAELRHLLTVADREWQGMIMTSLYVVLASGLATSRDSTGRASTWNQAPSS